MMINRLPPWFKQEFIGIDAIKIIRLLSEFNVRTVCQEAKCPNLGFCFRHSKLTFFILGSTCTRNCSFCAVVKSDTGRLAVDEDEPRRIAQVVKALGLKYAVITSVTRDDLPDRGAAIFASSIEAIHNIDIDKAIKIEVLIPDFSGRILSIKKVLEAGPNVVAHNIETVKRLYPKVRTKAGYQLSLDVLSRIKEFSPQMITKSSLMLGLGENEIEVIDAMEDLRNSQCDILCLGQYLAPSTQHYPVKEFISIKQFNYFQQTGLSLGFKKVLSGPLVRSSYQAQEAYKEANLCTI